MSKSDICLIIPPSPFLLDERVFVSLGILRIAAVLESAGKGVDVLDLSGVKDYEQAVLEYCKNVDTKLFGITATTPQLPAAVRISSLIRSAGRKVIVGGPHVTLTSAAQRKEEQKGIVGRATRLVQSLLDSFDVAVAGDGEKAIFQAMEVGASGLINADDVASNLYLSSDELNNLPLPARHLVDISSYKYAVDGERATSLIAQLGCPFGCNFCGGRSSSIFRRVRLRAAENIVEEIAHINRFYGFKGFMFYDDELNVNPKMLNLMELLVEKQKDIKASFSLRGFIKAELFSEEQALAMKMAGFKWILVGFESGSSRVLRNINKNSTVATNTRCLEIAKKHGLKVKALISLGHPGESMETIHETREWLIAVRPDELDITIITPYPGAPYYDDAVLGRNGVWIYTSSKPGRDQLYSVEVDYTVTPAYYKGVPGEYLSFVFTEKLSAGKLVEAREKLEVEIRNKLGLPRHQTALNAYEHSMGQSGSFLSGILKRT